MLGRCRHLGCRLDMRGQSTVISPKGGRKTNLEVEAHSRALHIRPVDGRRRNCSEERCQIVLVGCGLRATRRFVSNRLHCTETGILGGILAVLILSSFFSGREDSL